MFLCRNVSIFTEKHVSTERARIKQEVKYDLVLSKVRGRIKQEVKYDLVVSKVRSSIKQKVKYDLVVSKVRGRIKQEVKYDLVGEWIDECTLDAILAGSLHQVIEQPPYLQRNVVHGLRA